MTELLRRAAAMLDALVGPPPAHDRWTDGLADWHARYSVAAEVLARFADHEAGALREAMGPAWASTDPQPAGRGLLALAAIGVER